MVTGRRKICRTCPNRTGTPRRFTHHPEPHTLVLWCWANDYGGCLGVACASV